MRQKTVVLILIGVMIGVIIFAGNYLKNEIVRTCEYTTIPGTQQWNYPKAENLLSVEIIPFLESDVDTEACLNQQGNGVYNNCDDTVTAIVCTTRAI